MAIETLTIADLRGKTSASTTDTYCTTDLLQKGTWFYDSTDTTSLDNGNTIIVAPTVPQLTFKRIFDGVETTDYDGLLYKTANTAERYFTIDSGNQGMWYCDPTDNTSPASPTIIVGYYSPYLRFKRILNRVETTINEIRNVLTQFNIGETYYTTDFEQEGEWYFAGIDTVSEDNTGTILTSPAIPSSGANRAVFKRIYNGYINVKWFGAKGDGVADDIEPIQAAINWVTKTAIDDIYVVPPYDTVNQKWPVPTYNLYGGGTVFLPEGIYRITKNILVGANCKLLGVSKESVGFPSGETDNSSGNFKGTLISVDYNVSDNEHAWAIQSACFNTSVSSFDPTQAGSYYAWTGTTANYKQILNWDKPATGNEYDYKVTYNLPAVSIQGITHCDGITIEGIAIHCHDESFGGIKITAGTNCMIRNVLVTDCSIGILISASFGTTSIDHVWIHTLGFGIVLNEVAMAEISNSTIQGIYGPSGEFELNETIFEFIGGEAAAGFFANLGLVYEIIMGNAGIWASGCYNLGVKQTNFEEMYNGMVLLQTSSVLSNCYFEAMGNYCIVCASENIENNTNGILNADNITFGANRNGGSITCFFFGKGVYANIRGVKSVENTILYANNTADPLIVNRVITFTGSIYGASRYYSKDIIFLDESPYGHNKGELFIDPVNGSDFNYGYSENDPIKTFDAALIRVQDQKTINPIKTIFIKAAPNYGESVLHSDGAVIKNTEIVPIQNCDILITTYDSDAENLRGRIYFEGNVNGDGEVGQIELQGNVNLYFKNVDLVCNSPTILPSNLNMSLFGLRNSYAKLSFESDIITDTFSYYLFNIDMSNTYYLVQSNYPLGWISPKSLLDIKFVNIIINSGGGLSPNQDGFAELAVDCTQVNSIRYINSWADVIIIRDNF